VAIRGEALRSGTFGSFHAARTVNSTKLETWKERDDRERASAPFWGPALQTRRILLVRLKLQPLQCLVVLVNHGCGHLRAP
jgi:hypothetical protein